MGIEQKINYQLNKYPVVKKVIKRIYQRGMYAVSPKIKSEGDIIRISPDDFDHEYFFGYYDKSPWDITDRYMLCMKANDTWSDVSPRETADILIIDTSKTEDDLERVRKIAETRAWNVQQACMLQWLGPDFSSRVIYNDYRDGKYVSIILTLETMEEKIIYAPIYTVSQDGKFALTLDFSRLYNLRPGYGYYNVSEKTEGESLPDSTAIWKVDLNTGEVEELLKYTDFSSFEPRLEMLEKDAVHKVNHLMLSPNGKRFMVLYRWFCGHRKYTRLITCNVDGTDMYLLSDDDMVSHCFWKNNSSILAFENKKKSGPGYYLMKDKTQKYIHCWPQFSNDGHPSYSPDGSMIVTDSYPDRTRMASINLMDGNERKKDNITIAKVFAPFRYDNDTRCDLHPRWNRNGDKICFDAVFEGHRGLYVINILQRKKVSKRDANEEKRKKKPLITVIVPVYNVEKYLKRCVDSILSQTYKNLEVILVDDGSSDSSGRLCDDIANLNARVKVIHKENGGLSSARNVGIDVATGDLLTFVDSDDWIDDSIYQKCINVFENYDCDVVDFKVFMTDGKQLQKNKIIDKPVVIEKENILYDYLYRGQTEKCPFSVCRKIYRRVLYDNVRFPVGKINEDIVTNFKVLSKAGRLVHIGDVGYYYFQNPQSITSGKLRKKDFDLLDASKELCELSECYKDKRIYQLAEIKLARSYFSLLAKGTLGGFEVDIERPKQCARELTANLRKNYCKLMLAPIPKNRKVLITFMIFDYRLVGILARIFNWIKKASNRVYKNI